MKKATKKTGEKKGKRGRKPLFETRILPNLERFLMLYAGGATLKQLAVYFGFSESKLHEAIHDNPQFASAIARARMDQEAELQGKLWTLAKGAERVETSTTTTDSGKEYISKKKTVFEPSFPAVMALLKRHHGWSDNPKVDDAVAGALSDDELRARACRILNIPNTGDKSAPAK